jgi:hypothetical protein
LFLTHVFHHGFFLGFDLFGHFLFYRFLHNVPPFETRRVVVALGWSTGATMLSPVATATLPGDGVLDAAMGVPGAFATFCPWLSVIRAREKSPGTPAPTLPETLGALPKLPPPNAFAMLNPSVWYKLSPD